MEWQPPVPPGPSPEIPPAPTQQPPPGYGTSTGAPPPPGTWNGHPLAGWWSRVGATILDTLIVVVPIVIVAVAIDPTLGILGGLAASLTYWPLLMMRDGERNGQTLGKQIVGIRVVRESGERYTYGPAAFREFAIKYLLFGVVGGLFLIPPLLDDLWPLWDDQNRALHDMLASSRVVQA